MQEKHFITIAKKHANNRASKTETELVETFYDTLQDRHKSLPINLSASKKHKIKKAIDSSIYKKTTLFSYKTVAIAASFLILLGLGYSFLTTNDITTIATRKGERKEVLLADGSSVFLNANSSISYENNFTNNRNITLNGEAFFKVVRDTTSPFTVTSNTIKTQVLGTSFNINAKTNNKTKVSVNTGKVAVSSIQFPNNSVLLTKNQQVEFIDTKPSDITNNDSNDLMAWTKNIIILNNETLESTAKILENWYNITIDITDEALKQETLSGKFNNEKLETVLKSITLLKNLEINHLTPNHISIRKKE